MIDIELQRISEAITRNDPEWTDASGMLVECLTDAVCGITNILQQIDVTIADGFAKIEESHRPVIITAEEVNPKDIDSDYNHSQKNETTWPFNEKLQCHWMGWKPCGDGVLELHMPYGECCDMRGAISVGKALMPDVAIIVTYSGARLDTVYYRLGKRWRARSRA